MIGLLQTALAVDWYVATNGTGLGTNGWANANTLNNCIVYLNGARDSASTNSFGCTFVNSCTAPSNTGWAVGRGEEYVDDKLQDEVESNALYDLLEKDIVPLFYTRGADDLPRAWISKMNSSMRSIGPEFNTNRMVRDYTEKMYLTALDR